jgi:acyl transferase domain-containing protein
MKAVGQRYENLMSAIQPAKTKLSIPFFSSVTGNCIYEASSLGPSYWRSNMESPVLFLSAVESALQAEAECSIALEIGPHSTLSGPFRQICKDLEQKLQYLSTLNRGSDCTNTVLTALGQLYCHGVVPDFAEVNPAGSTMSNLPPYPWNHNVSYWHENRISHEFRSREFPEDELLGARVMGGTDLEPSWRKLLDVNSVPWLKDHIVSGDVIFPAAGYLAMIGKAIRQLSKISSFRIRNLSIDAAMILRIGKPTEIITRLQPHRLRSKLQSSSWYSFTVSSYDGSKWISNCSGEVRSGQSLGQSKFPPDVDAIRAVNSTDWYRVSKSVGLEWGPFFQALENIRCGVKRPAVVAEVRGQDLPEESYAVHPIAIDQLLQCCIIGSIQGQLRNMKKLVLPVHIGEVHVEVREDQADLQLRTEITSRHASSVFANGQIQDKNGSVMMECRDIQFRVLEHMTKDTVDHDALHKLQLLEWRPDIDLTDANQLIHRTSDLASCVELLEKLHILCSIETTRKLKNAETSQHHIRRLKEWNEQFLTKIQCHGSTVVQDTEYLFQINPEDRQALIRKLLDDALASPAKFVALAITRLYEAAEEIFHGKTDALAVLLADDVLTNTYNFNNMFDHEQLFQLLGHSNPGMRILEIGAGTGGFTSTVLPTLNKPGLGCMYSTYTYTDISSGFFKAAKERFGEYPRLEFVKLDISKDLVTQGFEHNSYDLVIAANVSLTTQRWIPTRVRD